MEYIRGAFIVVGIVMALTAPIYMFTVGRNKHLIRKKLEAGGAKSIHIVYIPFAQDRNNLTYDVKYMDADGNSRMATYKVRLGGSSMQWRDKNERS